jgi:hypothetical protein
MDIYFKIIKISFSRLLENYTYREGQSISASEIQEDIYKFIEDASCLPELGRLVKYALPWVKKVKMTIEVDAMKKRAYIFIKIVVFHFVPQI